MAENRSFVTKAQAALAIYDTPDPARVLIIDTSHWTGVVDWQVAKAAGVVGGIVKMLDGKARVNFAEENYRGLVDAGLLVGGYQWLYRAQNISPGAQAREYLAYLKDHPCDIRPAIDFEWTKWGGVASNPNRDDLYGHVIPFEDGYQKKPMIYTAPGYWNDPANFSKKGLSDTMWADYPLWGAQYRTKGVFYPFGPWGDNYKLFQFTPNGNGKLYGFPKTGEKEADLNYWPGTLADLYAWCKKDAPVVPPIERTLEERVTSIENRLEVANIP